MFIGESQDAPHGATEVLVVGALKKEVARVLSDRRAVKVEVARAVTVRRVRRAGPEDAVPALVVRGTAVDAGKHKPIRFCLDSISEGSIGTACSSNKPSFGEEEVGVGAITSIRTIF